MRPTRVLLTLLVCGASAAAPAMAAVVVEAEADFTATNNTPATAEAIPSTAFTTPVPATVFDPPGYPTATVTGSNGVSDVDFFAFDAQPGLAYFDIDNAPLFTFDPILTLMDSAGTMIASDDDSFPPDAGSIIALESFLGVATQPTAGTYYIVVTTFANFASSAGCSVAVTLFRPDAAFGGLSFTGCTTPSSFFTSGQQSPGATYILHVSVQNPGGDQDGDGVPDDIDVCVDTVIPEGVPTRTLRVNRFALVDDDGVFDTVAPQGQGGPGKSFTIADTAGCSCEQIIAALDLGKGHTKYGCSISAMEEWVALVNPPLSSGSGRLLVQGTGPTDRIVDRAERRAERREARREARLKRRLERRR